MAEQALLIKGANIHDGLGNVRRGCDVRVEYGRFAEISTDLPRGGAQVLEAGGLEMYPGFVVPLSPWGGAGPALHSRNLSERSSLTTPELDVRYAFQPDSIAYQQLYRWGITTSCLTPDFTNLFSGCAAVYKSYAESYEGYLLREKTFMAASLSASVKEIHAGKRYAETDMGLIHMFLETLNEAASSGQGVLYEVIAGRMPLVICCDDRSMWKRVSSQLAPYPKIRYTLCGTYGIRKEDLEQEGKRIPYIQFSVADGAWNQIDKVDYAQLDGLLENGALIALSPYLPEAEMAHAESVLWNAAVMYKNGVKAEHIVKSLCSVPAAILGVEDRVGSIEAGKDADFSLWAGNPVTSFAAQLQHVYIDGKKITEKEVPRYCW